MLLLRELGSALSGRVENRDPSPPSERPTVHWSYWSHVPTLYDGFAVGRWRKARVAQMPAEPIAPYTLRLVRSTDVFAHITEELRTAPIEWLRASAHSVERRQDGTYEVVTDGGACRLGVRQRAGCRACLSVPTQAQGDVKRHRHPRYVRPAGVRRGGRHPVRPARRTVLRLLRSKEPPDVFAYDTGFREVIDGMRSPAEQAGALQRAWEEAKEAGKTPAQE
jgi:hypothetical protein